MRILKKGLAFFLIVTMCIGCSVTAFADDNTATYTVSSATGAPGEEVIVTIDLQQTVANLDGLTFYITWEGHYTYLQLEEVMAGSALEGTGYQFSKSRNYELTDGIFYVDSCGSVNGEVLKLKFKISDDAPDGVSYKVDLIPPSYAIGSGVGWFCDSSFNYLDCEPTVNAGTITVASAPAEPSYTASYANTPTDSVKAGETFTSDVVVTSDSDLSSAQLTLGNPGTAAKIVSIENKLTGDNVSFESSENEDGSWLLSFYGNEASAKDGLTVATVTYEAVDEGSASLSMTAGSAGISGDTADYDITLPEASDVTVILPPISTVDYGGNYSLIKYEPASGENFTYDGKAMYVKDGVFYSVVAEGTEADRSLAAAAEGTASAYDSVEKGDINNSGVINIIDAQIAYDISNKVYSGFDKLTSDQIVKADVNNSLAVDASDARAIQVYVHTGSFASN